MLPCFSTRLVMFVWCLSGVANRLYSIFWGVWAACWHCSKFIVGKVQCWGSGLEYSRQASVSLYYIFSDASQVKQTGVNSLLEIKHRDLGQVSSNWATSLFFWSGCVHENICTCVNLCVCMYREIERDRKEAVMCEKTLCAPPRGG